jgi:hypothetical protein
MTPTAERKLHDFQAATMISRIIPDKIARDAGKSALKRHFRRL